MRRNSISMCMIFLVVISCNKKNTTETSEFKTDSIVTTIPTEEKKAVTENKFDINSIPISDKVNGSFPYFVLPDGYTYTDPDKHHGKGVLKDYDKEYFIVFGNYLGIEGRSFKAVVRLDDNAKDKQFSQLEIQKSFNDKILEMGGVKVNDNQKLNDGAKDKLGKDYFLNGYTHSSETGYNVYTYIIRKTDKVIWVQFDYLDNGSRISIIETKAFENKMSILSADEIKNQLNKDGKAILYINFDFDKSTLKSDGITAIEEIAKVLTNDKDLEISIEGHTDNTGDSKHNKILSEERAKTVSSKLGGLKIDTKRMKVVGYGSEKPLVSNDSEENKAKNRRVELVKL